MDGIRSSHDHQIPIYQNHYLAPTQLQTICWIHTQGTLLVHWQVSFGCWLTWSISSWPKYYKSVFFSQIPWSVTELFSVSYLATQARTFYKMNLLILSGMPFARTTETNAYFFFWALKLTKHQFCLSAKNQIVFF